MAAPFDRVVDVELPFRFELEHDDGDERLGNARDPVVVGCPHGDVRADVGEAGDPGAGRRRRTHIHDGARCTRLDERAREEREVLTLRLRLRRLCRDGCHGESKDG
jgi:hypothetical protein